MAITPSSAKGSNPAVYDADEDVNLSDARPPLPLSRRSDDNRGRRAEIVDGAVVGSGAGAGGGGREEIDQDAGGAGTPATGEDRPHPRTGADAPKHGSR